MVPSVDNQIHNYHKSVSFRASGLNENPVNTIPRSLKNNVIKLNNNKRKNITSIAKEILRAAGITAAIILSRGQKIKISKQQQTRLLELTQQGKIEQKYLDLFKDIEHLSGEDFTKAAYGKIAQIMRYENSVPELVIKRTGSGGKTTSHQIVIDLKSCDTKEKQLGVIRHELEHFRQYDLIYRAFGKDTFLNAKIMPSITKLKYNSDFCKKIFNGKVYTELSKAEISNYLKKVKANISTEKFEQLLKENGKIKVNSTEYKEAEKYLEAAENYKTPSMIIEDCNLQNVLKIKKENPKQFELAQEFFKEYKNNSLEKGAVYFENRIKEMYNLFISVINGK